MVALKFASSHNMVAFLDKPTESDGFKQIVDFLNAHPVKYALMVNPTIYTACIEQLWATAKVKTVNREVQIQALVDKKKVIVTETSIRRDLQLANENGTECLSNATIFAELERMGAKTTTWNEFSSTIASIIICLATNQRFNFSKYIFDNMVKNLQGGVKFLMYLSLSQRVIALETTKTNQALEIDSLKRRVKKLEKKKGSRTQRLKRLFRVTLVDDAQGRNYDYLMFDTGVLDEQEVEIKKVVSTTEVTTASATTTTVDELTLAQTLIGIKAAKPKAVTTAATTTTTAVTRPKARGVVVKEPSEFRTTTSSSQTSQLPQGKDKGKAKMVELEKPLKKKDQILIDEEIAQRLQEELQAELEEEERMERLERQKEKDENIVEWDNVQAMIDADYELAARLQAQEQEELTIEEKSKMLVELMDKRKNHFARLRPEEERRKPPTKLKREVKCMDTELVKESSKKAEMVQESCSKRAGDELEFDNSKKQKLDESVEVEVDDEAEMKKHMEIVSDDEGRIVGIKRLHDDLGVNTAKVRVTTVSAAEIKVNAAGHNC
ncbi:hypothetical protein Tco_1256442 [Tanacetum coccineum]